MSFVKVVFLISFLGYLALIVDVRKMKNNKKTKLLIALVATVVAMTGMLITERTILNSIIIRTFFVCVMIHWADWWKNRK